MSAGLEIEVKKISFSVPGVPVPGGSKKAWPIHARGCPGGRYRNRGPCVCRPRIGLADVSGERGKYWRTLVAASAVKAMHEAMITELWRGAIWLEMIFYMPRPKQHFGTGKNQFIVRNSAPSYHVTKPDLTKLLRSAEDALTNVLWADDCQIVDTRVRKTFARKTPGVVINASLIEMSQ